MVNELTDPALFHNYFSLSDSLQRNVLWLIDVVAALDVLELSYWLIINESVEEVEVMSFMLDRRYWETFSLKGWFDTHF